MSLSCIIQDSLLKIDSNLKFSDAYYQESPEAFRIFATLTYNLTACHHCHQHAVIRYGFKTIHLRAMPINHKPTILHLHKQRFMCRRCQLTWMAHTC